MPQRWVPRGPLGKKVKLEENQEYFEHAPVKQELQSPIDLTDGEEAENIPEYIPLVTSTSGEERGDNGDSDKDWLKIFELYANVFLVEESSTTP